MDPRLIDVVDFHARRRGAPAELIALLGPGRSHVVAEGLDPSWIDELPADRLSLVGHLGGLIIERGELSVGITAALAGGQVYRWSGQPGRLERDAVEPAAVETVALLWRLLDPIATLPGGSAPERFAEVVGRALLVEVVTSAMRSDRIVDVVDAVAAFGTGSLRHLASLAGLPRPPDDLGGSYLRGVLALGGNRRIPLPRGAGHDPLPALHRAVPYRWQIAGDVSEVLGLKDVAKALLACSPTWVHPGADEGSGC